MHIKETKLLLDELGARDHVSVSTLREAVAVDGFLTGTVSASEAATLGDTTTDEFRIWLERRGISHLLDIGREAGQVAISETPEISVVLPVFNEEENINELHRRLVLVLESVLDYELVFVNNNSSDRSAEIITDLQHSDPRIRLVNLSRNFGHQGSLSAGMDMCSGRAVILMDADLQDPPEVLPEMIEKWRDGADVVYAVRQKRKDGVIKRSAYFTFYRLLRRCADIDLPLDSGDFCLMDRAVVDHIKALPEKSRFLRGLRAWVGFQQVPLYYERAARHSGESKYHFRHLFKFALEGLVSFSSMPLRMAAYWGVLVCLSGIGYLAFAVISHFATNRVPPGWTSTVALILLLGGSQLVLLGVLGEYIARIYDETKKRPTYIVKSVSTPPVKKEES